MLWRFSGSIPLPVSSTSTLTKEEPFFEITFEEELELHEQAHDQAIKDKSKEQWEHRKKHGVLVGLVNGVFTKLPSSWTYPKRMNLIQLTHLWLMGVPSENVIPLRHVSAKEVRHFDRGTRDLNRMRSLMHIIEQYGRSRNVWKPNNVKNFWNGATVTRLWDAISDDLIPFLLTYTRVEGRPDSTHKSRCLTRSWRTCADKIIRAVKKS